MTAVGHARLASAGTNVDTSRRIELPESVRALVIAHTALVTAYAATSLRFTLDGRLVGDLAEATAAEAFGLELCKVRTAGVDAHAADGRSVQVKASGIGKGPAFTPGEGRADHLIFLLFDFEKAHTSRTTVPRHRCARISVRGSSEPSGSRCRGSAHLTSTSTIGGDYAGWRRLSADLVGAEPSPGNITSARQVSPR